MAKFLPYSTWSKHVVSVAPVLLVLCLIGQVSTGTEARLGTLTLFVVGLLLWVILLRNVTKTPVFLLWGALAVALVACVAMPPATSKDVNSYALYGQMAAAYDLSPYEHIPRDIAGDPWYERTSYFWSDSPSVYGPVFTQLSTLVMEVAGTSQLAARLGFQALAGVALLVAVALARRRMGNSAIVLIGLNPLLLTFGVNDGHCDLLIGAAVLAACLALEGVGSERRGRVALRAAVAGLAIALAVLVKVSVAPALVGAFLWLVFRRNFRAAIVFGGTATFVVAAALAATWGLEMLEPLKEAANRHTRFSLWNPPHQLFSQWMDGGLPTQTSVDRLISSLAQLAVVGVGAVIILRHRRDVSPVIPVVAGLVVYQVLGAYTLSWYAAWSLPALALAWNSRTAVVAMLHGSWVAIAYLSGYGAIVVLLVLTAWFAWRRASRDRPILERSASII